MKPGCLFPAITSEREKKPQGEADFPTYSLLQNWR